MENVLIWNTHPWRLCTLYIVKKILPLKLEQFINSPLESINFTFFGMWTCHNGFMVPKNLIFGKVPNQFSWVFGLVLMWCNFGEWFSIGHKNSNSIFLVTVSSKFSFFSPLWKVTSSSMSIFGNLSCFKPPMCLIWTLSYKTCSIIFVIILSTLLAYYKL